MSKFTNLTQNFTIIPNWLINNPNVSLKAKGLFIFLASKPNDFEFSAERISKLNKEGVTAIKNCLKELEDNGFLIRKKIKNADNSRFIGIEYILTDKPSDGKTVDGKSNDGKSNVGEPTDINNKELYKKEINNKELNNNNICEISEIEVLEYEEIKKEKSSAKKEKENKPDLNEFLEYAEQIIIENNLGSLNEYKLAIEAKFEQWSNNDWKDGHGKPIKRWKPKLKTAFQYFKPIRQNGYGNIQQQSKEQPVIGRMSEETVKRNLQGW